MLSSRFSLASIALKSATYIDKINRCSSDILTALEFRCGSGGPGPPTPGFEAPKLSIFGPCLIYFCNSFAYLRIKSLKDSRALKQTLDPSHKRLAVLAQVRYATSAIYALGSCTPLTPRQNPGSAPGISFQPSVTGRWSWLSIRRLIVSG